MFDPRPCDADVETVPHLALVPGGELAAQEGGDVVRLHRLNRRQCQILVNGLQVGLLAENDIGGVFALIYAPTWMPASAAICSAFARMRFRNGSVDFA
jgi:hypothetical protein